MVLEDCTLRLPDGGHRTFRHRTIRIGSHPDNDVVLEGPAVSRFHAEVTRMADGYAVRDVGSTNGTRVNEVRVLHAYLEDGDVLHLGDVPVGIGLERRIVTSELSGRDRLGELIGQAPAMRRVFHLIEQVAPTDATLLVTGETGTGKEVVAQTVHALSRRAAAPLVAVDCGTIHPPLLESTLFGHERGAFTGAVVAHKGLFEQADRSTVFIDEIAELPLEPQTRLLRVIESQEIRRVGATKSLQLDLRFIAATHRDVPSLVRQGQFREDLYHRLNTIPLRLPPLRERREDIPLLANHLLATASWNDDGEGGRRLAELSPAVMAQLVKYDFPGNVRELANLLRRAATVPHLDIFSLDESSASAAQAPESMPELAPFKEAKEEVLRSFTLQYCTALMAKANGNISKAARIAGLARPHLRELLRKVSAYSADQCPPETDEREE